MVSDQRRAHVLQHGELAENVGVLERPADAHAANGMGRRAGDVAPFERHAAAVGAQMASQKVEEGRLAGAVRTDHGGDGLRRNVQADVGHSREAVEGFAHVAGAKHRCLRKPQEASAQCAEHAAREHEHEHDQDRAENERPVLRVGIDVLVEQDQDRGADGWPPEMADAAQDGHDEYFRRFRPVGEVGEHTAIEYAEQGTGPTGERARHHEGGELVATHVHADEFRALGVLADGGQNAAERGLDDAPQEPESEANQQQDQQIVVVARCAALPTQGTRTSNPCWDRARWTGPARHQSPSST